ncbi:YciI family protein [Propioniciclava soli]|uniref:YciI family protein n=1 Tax=Propioniciclava soli TaxID=2775081 RepID=A0ABZ3C312_9ACTN|nr:YciI family protein [Propioniciclava soli]
MSLYAVTYTYVDDAAALDEIRPRHREFLGGLAAEGIILLSGPTQGDGPFDALILLRAGSADDAAAALAHDPFQQAGLVSEITVSSWNAVLGAWRDGALAGQL